MSKIHLTPIHSPKHEGVSIAYFRCPGCGEIHGPNVGATNEHFPVAWGFNGDIEEPTFTPSLLVKSGHYAQSSESCWCKYNAEHPDDPAPYQCGVCHSFVTNGQIQFLSDCTHALAGKTVELPEWEALD